jgi:FkbM family methyltransferase
MADAEWDTLRVRRTDFIKSRRFKEAHILEVDYLKKYPDDAKAHVAAAWTSAALGELDRAIFYLRRAIALEPENIRSRFTLASVLAKAAAEVRSDAEAIAQAQMNRARESQRRIVENALAVALPRWQFSTEHDLSLRYGEIFEKFSSDASPDWATYCAPVHVRGDVVDLRPIGLFRVGDTNQIIHKRFARRMPWELPIASLVMELASRCGDSAIMVDVGANIGAITVPMARAHRGCVLAIEPDGRNYTDLRENTALNDLVNVTTIQVAVSDQPGRAALVRPVDNPTNPHIETTKTGEIVVRTIDELCEKPIALIKLDIEGHEARAIRGAISLIHRYKPIILSEILGYDRGVFEELSVFGYSPFNLGGSDWMFVPA